MRGYSANRSSNEDAAKTRATLGPPARRAAAMRASISPRMLTGAGGALTFAVVTASDHDRRRDSGTTPTRNGWETPRSILTVGLIPANVCTGTSIQPDPSWGNSSGDRLGGRASSAARMDRLPWSSSHTRPSRAPADTTVWSTHASSRPRPIEERRVHATLAARLYTSRTH